MFWPNWLTCRNAMNFGATKMQMSSAAVPPIRTSPIALRPHSLEVLGHDLEADAARRLDQDRVAGLDELGQQRGRLVGVLDRLVAVHRGGARADGHEQVHAAGTGVLTDLT